MQRNRETNLTEYAKRILLSHFSELYSSFGPTNIQTTCEVVKGKLSDENKAWYEGLFTKQDVEEVIFHMHPLKALGPYGLPGLLFQKYWYIIGNDVKKMVLNILNNDQEPAELN